FRAGTEAFFIAERFVAENAFDCDYRRSGLGILAWSARHMDGLREELAEDQSIGLTGRVVEGAALKEEVGTDYYPGGLFIEESGMIHPAKYYAAVLAAARAAGARVMGGHAVKAIETDGPDKVVVTEAAKVRAGAVLVATNGYTDGAVPWLQRRVM